MNSEWRPVATALLGSWPSQVASWGHEALAAYIAEIGARGVTPDAALVAIRSCPAGQKFPPSAPELAALARQDPERPTFEELYAGLYRPGGVFSIKRSGVVVSPWVLAFVDYAGRDYLHGLPLNDPNHGKWARRELEQAYDRFLLATENRAVAELAGGRRRQLGRFDPLAALEAGS